MPYKLIIVDDEDIIRRGLASIIDWDKLGFEIVGSFKDGKDAIEYLLGNSVDIVFSDIKMTTTSGLEIAKFVHENRIEIKIVLISGHKEFELAKQALQYNVSNYLLKPTRIDEIADCFQKIKETLDCERKKTDYKQLIESKIKTYEDNLSAVEEQLLQDVIAGSVINPKDILKRLCLSNIDIDPGKLLGCIAKIIIRSNGNKMSLEAIDGLSKFVRNILTSTSQDIKCMLPKFTEEVIIIIAMDTKNVAQDQFEMSCQEMFNQLKQAIEVLFNTEVEISFSKCFRGIDNLRHQDSFGDNLKKQSDFKTKITNKRLLENEKLLFSSVFIESPEAIQSRFIVYFDEACLEGLPKLQESLIKVFAEINRNLSENMHTTLREITNDDFHFSAILSLNDKEEIRLWGCKQLIILANYLVENRGRMENLVVSKAKVYVQNNFSRNLSLEDVAEAVYHNPTYLSRLFKEKTGENYMDYLTRIRIEKAKQLLKDPRYKVYEVSGLVGYKSYKYFSRLFQKLTGKTPSDFR